MATERGRHADRELDQQPGLEGGERAQAYFLLMGALRRRGEIDARIEALAKRPVGGLDPEVRAALRVALFELAYGRTPPHAAVDQGVRLVGDLGAGRAGGFVNALLRRGWEGAEAPSACANHPDWLVARWRARFGDEATERWCRANDDLAPLALITGGDAEALAERLRAAGLEVTPGRAGGRAVPGSLLARGQRGPVSELPGYEAGEWWVMDPASAAAADLLAARVGERVLDACAAPGGKTLRLAAAGAEVYATDLEPARLGRLRANLERVGLSARVGARDWLAPGIHRAAPFDAALLDAPCTGLGTLRRHPEIRWSRIPTDPAAMALRQSQLIERVAAQVRPGGRLVYSVCSPAVEEGADVAAGFLASPAGADWRLAEALTIAPPTDGEDAFYAARLERTGAPP